MRDAVSVGFDVSEMAGKKEWPRATRLAHPLKAIFSSHKVSMLENTR